MATVEDRKKEQGYRRKGPHCGNCAFFRSRFEMNGTTIVEKDLRCSLGAFATPKTSWCERHETVGYNAELPGYPREETIRCPQCDRVQAAQVHFEDWMPFPAYVHDCEACCYTIMESEWERVPSQMTRSS